MPISLSEKEVSDIIQWDIKNWKRSLSFWDKHFPVRKGMKVLAIGEREGGLSLYFAKNGCDVLCTDFRDFPDATKEMHKNYGIEVSYVRVDMTAIPCQENTFDIVVFKSVIGALGDKKRQNTAMNEIYRVLKPGGALLFSENAKGFILYHYLRTIMNSWSYRWRYITTKDIEQWQSPFSTVYTDTYGFLSLLGRSEKQRSILAFFDKIFCRLTPKKWHYILFGVFIK
ncbi:class I SAM-dependent methyltransferase [Endozoicomonadaceae bacterium StTr2]